jgi:SAM-dependent methyltransferase
MRARDRQAYYAATDGRPPRPTLLRALAAFAREGRGPGLLAADLGCGIGRDAVALLRAGWRVWAIDAEAAALAELETRAAAEGLSGGLATVHGRCEELELPSCDLANDSFALFACPPAAFERLWSGMVGRCGRTAGSRGICWDPATAGPPGPTRRRWTARRSTGCWPRSPWSTSRRRRATG